MRSITDIKCVVRIHPSMPVGKDGIRNMSKVEDDAHGSQASNEKVQDLCIQCIAQGFGECHHLSQKTINIILKVVKYS